MPFTGLQELCKGLAVPLLLGLIGGIVRIIWFKVRTVTQIILNLLVSMFIGVVVFWGLDYFDFAPTVDAAIVSLAASMGYPTIDALQTRLIWLIKRCGAPSYMSAAPAETIKDGTNQQQEHKPPL